FGFVDEENESVWGPAIPGMTSFLATFTWDTEYPGLNSLAESEKYGAMEVSDVPVAAVFQTYHLMVALSGVLALFLIIVFVALKKDKLGSWRWLQKLLLAAPLFPFIAIEAGWFTAELGRQPWVVYPSASAPDGVELLTNIAYSPSVTTPELLITLVLFTVVYLLLFVAWVRMVSKQVKAGPVHASLKEGE
ncbi:MAG: cytochrome ubiquinol oxidase subunit I, partial [Eggerthellaceae bacterium]|nr:cytochrome ubiquinol oxidase subunit I [Eggerthellaceae bacterium]